MDVAKPYKGPESFEVQDEPLFFGRAREKEQFIAKCLLAIDSAACSFRRGQDICF